MKKGSDCDVEVFYPDGFAVPADAKCKFETTEINPQSILHSLKKAQKQLAGIIFMKVPQSWVADVGLAVQMVDIGLKFMRNTDRIVSIKFYVSLLKIRDNMVMHRRAYKLESLCLPRL